MKWKSLATVGSSNDKTVNWNQYLLKDLLPAVYENLFNYLKTLEVGGCSNQLMYAAWPDVSCMDQKWTPLLTRFYQQMRKNQFVYVESQKKWFPPEEVSLIKDNEMMDGERKAVEMLLTKLGVPFATIPVAITNQIKCKWITGEKMNQNICTYPNQYLSLGMEAQCNLLSYTVKTTQDLKLLINQRILPLSNGVTYFQLLRNHPHNQYFMTTDEIQPSLLPTVERNVNIEFFDGNKDFQERLKNILLQGIHILLF